MSQQEQLSQVMSDDDNTQQSQSQQTTTDSTTDSAPKKEKWVPLECSPDILQDALGSYGVTDSIITEVYGEELFDMVPQPIEGLIVLFPCDPQIISYIDATFPVDTTSPNRPIHIKQKISNACGTFALTHLFLNLREVGDFTPQSPFETLQCQIISAQDVNTQTSDDRAALFKAETRIKTIHESFAESGQTNADNYENTEVHYIAFFRQNDIMWLLDGAKAGPMNCGEFKDGEELLHKAWAVAKKMHEIWGKEQDFAVLAATRNE